MNTLFLGSRSQSRQDLLRQMAIPFQLVEQSADEEITDKHLSFNQIVRTIARQKMEYVIMPNVSKSIAYVLTADTMGKDVDGTMHGKPVDRNDAIAKIKALRKGGIVATAFCLDKKRYENNEWRVEQRAEVYVETKYIFDMPDAWIEKYLAATPGYMNISGAITVEGFGAQFLKSIEGSYTSILGLPVFELREALEHQGFFAD